MSDGETDLEPREGSISRNREQGGEEPHPDRDFSTED